MSRVAQELRLREAGASWVVHVGKQIPDWTDAAKAVRPDTVVYIPAGVMVPASKGKHGPLPAQWTTFVACVHQRGGYIVEVLTGLKSNNIAQLKTMNEATLSLLKRGGKLLPAQVRGRKPLEWPSIAARNDAFAIWTDLKNVASDAAAIRLCKKFGVTEALLKRFGPSGRNE